MPPTGSTESLDERLARIEPRRVAEARKRSKVVTLRMDAEFRAALREAAYAKRVSLNSLCLAALEALVEQIARDGDASP